MVDDILNRLSSAQVFSKLDLISGYFQMRVKEDDAANRVFAPLLNKCVMVYLHNILVYSGNINDHYEGLRKVLQLLSVISSILKNSSILFSLEMISWFMYWQLSHCH